MVLWSGRMLMQQVLVLDSDSVNGITVYSSQDNLDNRMVYVKREEVELSQAGTLL